MKLPELIESSKFVSHRAQTSGEFDSRKDSHLTKFKRRPLILVKLSFRGLCDSKLGPESSLNFCLFRKTLPHTKFGCKLKNVKIFALTPNAYSIP